MTLYADYLRWLYRSGWPNLFARLQNRLGAIAFATGISPNVVRHWRCGCGAADALHRFRPSSRTTEGECYLVSMLGENVNWVRNVRADAGRAVLRHGQSEDVTLMEVAMEARPAILRRYLTVAPGARST